MKLKGKEDVYTSLQQNVQEEMTIERIMKTFGFEDDLIVDMEFKGKEDSKEAETKKKSNNKGEGNEGKAGGKKAAKNKNADEDSESEVDLEEFKDLKDLW